MPQIFGLFLDCFSSREHELVYLRRAMSFGRNNQTNIFNFIVVKRCNLFESFFRSFILLEIVENWHTKCKGHTKRCPHFSSLLLDECGLCTKRLWGKTLIGTVTITNLINGIIKLSQISRQSRCNYSDQICNR